MMSVPNFALLMLMMALTACAAESPSAPMSTAMPMSDRDFYRAAFVDAERIPLSDIDMTVPDHFAPGQYIEISIQVRFRSDDARLYSIPYWSQHRPMTSDRREIVLPYEHIAPDDVAAYILPTRDNFLWPTGRPQCVPTIDSMRLVVVSPIRTSRRVGIWVDEAGNSAIVTFPNDYRCSGAAVDRRYHIIPAGRERWAVVLMTSNLHLPPSLVLMSHAEVGQPITYARMLLTPAAVTFAE